MKMSAKKEITLKRLANILIYFANNTDNCGVVKANKLIYYLDCYHLLKYGKKVTPYVYKKLPEGPVPEEAYRRIDSILKLKNYKDDFEEFLCDYIDIVIEEYFDYNLHKIVAKNEFVKDWFSKSELEIIEQVANEFRYHTAKELSNKTHEELPYKRAESYENVDLLLYLTGKVDEDRINTAKYIEESKQSMDSNYNY